MKYFLYGLCCCISLGMTTTTPQHQTFHGEKNDNKGHAYFPNNNIQYENKRHLVPTIQRGHEEHDHDMHGHEGHDHDKHDHEEHDHDKHEHEEHDPHDEHDGAQISPQARANIGIETQTVTIRPFVITTPVSAKVESHPQSLRTLTAPFAGIIEDFSLEIGQALEQDQVLLTLLREPIPRPSLRWVEHLLAPGNETAHDTIAVWKMAKASFLVLNTEWKRIEGILKEKSSMSLVSQRDLTQFKLQHTAAQQTYLNAREKLALHGLSEDALMQGNTHLGPNENTWLKTLKNNGLWKQQAAKALRLFPKQKRKTPWVIATISELEAEGFLSDALINMMAENGVSSQLFLNIATLLQQGHSIQLIQHWIRHGSLDERVKIRVPVGSNWSLQQHFVQPGAQVQQGDDLVQLINQERKQLSVPLRATDFKAWSEAIANQTNIKAISSLSGTAMTLEQLKVTSMLSTDSTQPVAIIPMHNEILTQNQQPKPFRNWKLIDGMRFNVHLPVRQLDHVVTFPLDALINFGAEKIVYVETPHGFQRRNVKVEYQDHLHVVLGQGTDLRPGENVVTRGALALHLALIAGTPQTVDPHAGHSH